MLKLLSGDWGTHDVGKMFEAVSGRPHPIPALMASLRDVIMNQKYLLSPTGGIVEHIADDRGTVAALRARLKPNGSLLIYVPAFPVLFSSMDRKVGHRRRYRRAGLATLVANAGFAVTIARYQDCLGFFAALLFKWVGNHRGTIDERGLIAYDRYVFPASRCLDRWAGRWFGKNLLIVARRND